VEIDFGKNYSCDFSNDMNLIPVHEVNRWHIDDAYNIPTKHDHFVDLSKDSFPLKLWWTVNALQSSIHFTLEVRMRFFLYCSKLVVV
jgi:hypothetical protein